MRKILLLFFSFLFIVLPVFAQEGEQIRQYKVNIDILESGKVAIREEIVYDFGNLDRHGIFREIPYTKTNDEGKKFEMTLSDFRVVDEKGEAYQYQKTNESDNIHLKIGDPDSTITGVHRYNISYTVSGALTYFSDHDELYWDAIGTGWGVSIAQTSVTISAPKGEGDYRFNCFTGYSQSEEKNCTISESLNIGTIIANQPLSPSEGLTIVAGFPIDLVAHLEPKAVVGFFDTIFGKMVAIGLILLGIWWYLIYPFWILAKWFLYGRDPIIGATLTAFFEPPSSPSGNKLKPGEAGVLIDETVHSRDVAATMVDLARRGWYSINEKNNDETILEKHEPSKKPNEKLALFEQKLFDEFFKSKNTFELKNSNLYTTVKEVEKELYENVVKHGFFIKNPNSIRNFYTVIGTIALTTLSLALAFSAFIFGRAMPKKTRSGAIEAGKAKGLKNFLKSQERMIDFQSKTGGADLSKQTFFENLLPYAVAFGVEKDWIKRFETLDLKQPEWFSSYRGVVFADSFGQSMNSTMDNFRASATPTSSSSGFSSGFSGGSSGGGGGGGGGGSW